MLLYILLSCAYNTTCHVRYSWNITTTKISAFIFVLLDGAFSLMYQYQLELPYTYTLCRYCISSTYNQVQSFSSHAIVECCLIVSVLDHTCHQNLSWCFQSCVSVFNRVCVSMQVACISLQDAYTLFLSSVQDELHICRHIVHVFLTFAHLAKALGFLVCAYVHHPVHAYPHFQNSILSTKCRHGTNADVIMFRRPLFNCLVPISVC